jgi:hypothetical protein
VAEIAPEDVRLLWAATSTYEETTRTAAIARENLDRTLLEVARRAKVGLSELSAVTGLHPNTVRAGIQRAAGESAIDFEQPELDLTGLAPPADGLSDELRALQARRAAGNPTPAAAAAAPPVAATPTVGPAPSETLEATLDLGMGR